jgi:predicted nucleic acid-binding protein
LYTLIPQRTALLLDAGPLGMLCSPNVTPANTEINVWLERVLLSGIYVVHPEITDYEVRRDLVRIGAIRSLRKLDRLKATLQYFPLYTDVMLTAAEIWAEVRRAGRTTADKHALDGDVILAACAAHLDAQGFESVIASAYHWNDIILPKGDDQP